MEFKSDRSIEEIAASIRSIRKQKGLTLKDVEVSSKGLWKAVVVGSYERCDRALSLKKAIALAAFYQVPLDQLLGLENHMQPGNTQTSNGQIRITLDLKLSLTTEEEMVPDPAKVMYQTFLTLICAKRRDWNGEVLSLRYSDLETLAIIGNKSEFQMLDWLRSENFLIGKF
jgi:transcriptional regulator with XRE-family HTH domain